MATKPFDPRCACGELPLSEAVAKWDSGEHRCYGSPAGKRAHTPVIGDLSPADIRDAVRVLHRALVDLLVAVDPEDFVTDAERVDAQVSGREARDMASVLLTRLERSDDAQ